MAMTATLQQQQAVAMAAVSSSAASSSSVTAMAASFRGRHARPRTQSLRGGSLVSQKKLRTLGIMSSKKRLARGRVIVGDVCSVHDDVTLDKLSIDIRGKRESSGGVMDDRMNGVASSELSELLNSANQSLGNFVKENARELAIGSLVFALVCLPDENALALGPGGPLFEEFWDNVRRYGFYFFTVVSGGLYSLAKPLLDLLKEPSTQFLVAIVVTGTFYLVYLTVSTMLGLNDFDYQYAQ